VAAGDLTGSLVGAGASSQQAAMQGWTAGYSGVQPGVTVNYDPVGSGGGREQFIAGGTDFAGSDAALDEEELTAAAERCGGGEVFELPNYISPIAVVYNLEGVDGLNLSPEVVAGIFDQQIANWNDPAIAADNPGVTLPDLPITPVNRSDESGTTENFTEYLAAAAGEAWPHEPDGNWPVEGGEAAQGTSGVVSAVGGGNGTIGYADLSQAGELGVANIGVGEEFVTPSPEAAAAVVENSERVQGRGEYDFAIELARDTAESGSYPIVLVSYHIGCIAYDDQEKAGLIKDFMGYVISEEGQQAAAQAAGSAPISDALREQAQTAVDAITAG
jgi:phosphate transport system substrate-binding protein